MVKSILLMQEIKKSFNHFKLHTQYSICEGAIKIEDLEYFCKNNKIKSIGISDTSNLCGVLQFSETVSKSKTQPIIGSQIKFKHKDLTGLIPIIAKNDIGYKNIVRLSSNSYLKHKDFNEPFCEFNDLVENKDGLIITLGGLNSIVGDLFKKDRLDDIKEIYIFLKNLLKDNFYIEIQRHQDLNEKNLEIYKLNLSNELDIPIIASQEIYYLEKDLYEAHDALMCIGSKSYINDKTRIIWVETPTNPMINIFDIKSLSDICKKYNILLVVDNTFASPYLQTPINLGADIVMHSATKYLAGHSDVVLGALMLNDDDLAEKLYFIQNATGAVPGPQDCFLTLRGIKTLHVRIQRHCENARKIAHYLQDNPKVEKVYWPGLPSHKNHLVAKNQMSDFGGMLSFQIKRFGKKETILFLEKLKLFTLAESLGGVESLCGHPATMTHASIPKEERVKSGVTDSLIRLSIGIEDVEDLINDLKQAFL